ncbi:MAG: DUF2085 domain-containing protein [Bacteroidetes bacterium]|nr:DUF2085 domain-containing protein [Bacteroidota bacterium]
MNEVSGVKEFNYTDEKTPKKVYFVILIFSTVWLILIFSAPLLKSLGGLYEKMSSFLYLFFSPVCHQEDARSFHIFNEKIAVCSRCLWIYTGFLSGTIIYPLKYRLTNLNPPSVFFLITASVLLGLDVLLDGAGIFRNTFFSRSLTGFIIGSVLPFYLIPGFTRFFSEVNLFLKNKFIS